MPKILIVDDEKQNIDAMVRALGDANPSWTLLTASSEVDGLRRIREELLKDEPIDLVLTDLVMESSQSGTDLVSAARKVDPSIMAILFTANEHNLDRYAAFAAGAFDVIEKNMRGVSASREISIKARAALESRERFLQLNFLRRYFDPQVFETIIRQPSLLELKSRHVAVAFWDIRGFSAICEILKDQPHLISEFLREYCELAARLIFENGGVLDKFIGDGVMALFGVLASPAEDKSQFSERALRTAIAFKRSFTQLSEKWLSIWRSHTPHQIDVGLGCGINCGEALVGNVGTHFREQFTALGTTVNFAARIESKSKAGQILVSQAIQTRLRDKLPFTKAAEVSDIKNIAGTFDLFELTWDQLKLY